MTEAFNTYMKEVKLKTGIDRICQWLLLGVFLMSVAQMSLVWAQSQETIDIAPDDTVIEPSATNAPDTITLQFEDAPLINLVTAVADFTGKTFIISPRSSINSKKVTILSGSSLSADDVYGVFLSVLEVNEMSTVEVGDIVKIIPINQVKQTPTRTFFEETPDLAPDEQITQVYQLQHAQVQDIFQIIQRLIPQNSAAAMMNPSTNTLVLSDTAANVERILEIIRSLDKPSRRSEIRVVFLKYAQANNLASILSQLGNTIGSVNGIDPAVPGARGGGQTVTIHADEQSNALIIQAPENEFQVLQQVIDELDNDLRIESNVHVVKLKHAEAETMAALLTSLSQSAPAADGVGGVASDVEVAIQADEQTNSLVIRASGDQFAELKTIIDELDERRAQVYVEVIIALITADKDGDFGFNWTINNGPGLNNNTAITRDQTSVSTGFTNVTGGVNLTFTNRFVTDLAGNVVPDLQAVLSALQTDNAANILSTPNLLTLDNQEAEIIVGQEVPFITGTFETDADTTTEPFQTIEREEVGLNLKMTPQINEGDTIRLNIDLEISDVAPTQLQNAVDITTNTRSIKTNVQVDDGQIIVLGGLIRDNIVDNVSWVPILGRLPLIGWLFRSKSKQVEKTNLMMFLRPKIVRSQDEADRITSVNYDHIQQVHSSTETEKFGYDLIPEEQIPRMADFEDTKLNEDGVFAPIRQSFIPPTSITGSKGKKKYGHLEKVYYDETMEVMETF